MTMLISSSVFLFFSPLVKWLPAINIVLLLNLSPEHVGKVLLCTHNLLSGSCA